MCRSARWKWRSEGGAPYVGYETRFVPASYDTRNDRRMRDRTTPYNTVRHRTIPYDTVRHRKIPYGTVRHRKIPYDTRTPVHRKPYALCRSEFPLFYWPCLSSLIWRTNRLLWALAVAVSAIKAYHLLLALHHQGGGTSD